MPYTQGFQGIIGKLYFYSNNRWNRVCDNTFTQAMARIACRTLGLTGGDRGVGEDLPEDGE